MIRLRQQSRTFFLALAFIFGSVIVCKFLADSLGAGVAAIWISVTNIAVPTYLRTTTLKVEDHVSLNDQQLSLFFKLSFFRWMNSAVVIYIITEFSETLTMKTLKQVQAVLIADALTTPLVRTLNPMELVNKLFISSFTFTQEKMNSYFLGTIWYPAERYADLTKTCFLALFWCALYPQGLFVTSLAYVIAYLLDKYSLLRTWRTPAELDDDLAKKSRGHIALSVYVHTVMTMVFYAGWPFDNVCPKIPHEPLESEIFEMAHHMLNVTSPMVYQACDQNMIDKLGAIFIGADITETYMYSKQKRSVAMYALIVLFMTVILIGVFFGKAMVEFVLSLFYGSFEEETNANETHFCDVEEIQAYIPGIFDARLTYPLIGTYQ